MHNVFVTGATSMLGIALIEECVKNDVEVTAVVRENSRNIDRIPNSSLISIVECDISNLLSLKNLGSNYDVFYHFAWADTSREGRNNPLIQQKNIKYTLDAVNLANNLKCKKFIGAGSQAEYGIVSHTISYNTPVNPVTPYGVSKYAAGKLSNLLCGELGISHIWTRIFSTYGPNNMDDTLIMYAINSFLNHRKPSFTKSEQQWDYLYCKDAGKAFYLIGKKGKQNSVYCLGSGQTHSIKEFIIMIRDSINPNLEIGIGDLDYSPNQVMHLCADISNLTEDTGFKPETNFNEGIKKTIKWVKHRDKD